MNLICCKLLSFADVRDTNLQNAILSNTRLTKAQLSGTNLDAARDVPQADLGRANLRGTNLGPVVCVTTNYPYCVLNLD